jgi:RecB family exonuclease
MTHYANSNLDLRHVDRNTIEAFSRCSSQWHTILGLEPPVDFDLSLQGLTGRIDRIENSKIIMNHD